MTKKTLRVLLLVSLAVTLIGAISFVCKTRNVNAGAFIFPGIIAVLLFAAYRKSRDA